MWSFATQALPSNVKTMELLERVLQFALEIPETAAHGDERDFSFIAVAHAAFALSDAGSFLAAIAGFASDLPGSPSDWKLWRRFLWLRRALLEELLAPPEYFERHLFRRDLGSLAPLAASEFGLTAATAVATQIGDAFTCACWPTELVGSTPDRVLQKSLLLEAWGDGWVGSWRGAKQ